MKVQSKERKGVIKMVEATMSPEQIDELVGDKITGLGKRIDLAMRAAGVRTNRRLGQIMGVSHVAVGSWIKGQYKPDIATLCKLSLILDQKLSYFFGETPLNENPKPNFEWSREGLELEPWDMINSDAWAGSSVEEHRTFNPDSFLTISSQTSQNI
jgi:transcriptional regulator with XRE-family HTH domain